MADRHHCVAQFHLREFADPASANLKDRWLWVANCKTGEIRRRSPKNFGWIRGLFEGPGALADRNAALEDHLAKEVEGPAASALRRLKQSNPPYKFVAPEIMRYLAWAAARSLPMKALYQSWADALPADDAVPAEPPLSEIAKSNDVQRTHEMTHPTHGRRVVPTNQVDGLLGSGWRLILSDADFLELAHAQASYFQLRFFPRFQWMYLHAPPGANFIIGDRPVIWGFDGNTDVTPSALRHPNCQIISPLSSTFALIAFHPIAGPPGSVTTHHVNAIVASGAAEWIAGPTERSVFESLRGRTFH